jgi:uncharacterized protein (DUF4415 family)
MKSAILALLDRRAHVGGTKSKSVVVADNRRVIKRDHKRSHVCKLILVSQDANQFASKPEPSADLGPYGKQPVSESRSQLQLVGREALSVQRVLIYIDENVGYLETSRAEGKKWTDRINRLATL